MIRPPLARARLLTALAVFSAGWLVFGSLSGWFLGFIVGWCLALTTLDCLAWWLILTSGPEEARARAAVTDPGRPVVWGLALAVGLVTVLSLVPLLSSAPTLAPHGWMIVLCLWGGIAGWILVHTAFTLHYAHLYYRDVPEPAWGLEFPGGKPPSELDFAYVAFTIGTSYAVSDVQVTCPQIRSMILLHSSMSFLYNTGLLAFVINLVLTRLQT